MRLNADVVVSASVTRLGDFFIFGQLFKACGNNYFPLIAPIFWQKLSKSFILLMKSFLGNFYIYIWRFFTGHTANQSTSGRRKWGEIILCRESWWRARTEKFLSRWHSANWRHQSSILISKIEEVVKVFLVDAKVQLDFQAKSVDNLLCYWKTPFSCFQNVIPKMPVFPKLNWHFIAFCKHFGKCYIGISLKNINSIWSAMLHKNKIFQKWHLPMDQHAFKLLRHKRKIS